MQKTMAFLSSVILVASACAHAPTLVNGTWIGSGVPPGGGFVELEYKVTGEGDSLAITVVGEFGEFAANDILLEDDELKFWFSFGERFECVLKLQEDESYFGDCVGVSGDVASLRMGPPPQG